MSWNFFQKKTDEDYLNNTSSEKTEQTIRNKKFEHLGLYELVKTLPWKANDIYLEDNNKQVKAVCSTQDIARVLANCVDHYSSFPGKDVSKMVLYKDFMQDAYYLYIAMSKAKIPVNSIEIAFVEKAFHQFCQSFNKLLSVEHIRLDPIDNDLVEK